jgi:hypothetical protein
MFFGVSSVSYAENNESPSFKKGEPYKVVRDKMVQLGWKPFHSESADECTKGDIRCEGRPEMEACAGTGMANCKFLWVKESKKIAICTIGENASFDAVCTF